MGLESEGNDLPAPLPVRGEAQHPILIEEVNDNSLDTEAAFTNAPAKVADMRWYKGKDDRELFDRELYSEDSD